MKYHIYLLTTGILLLSLSSCTIQKRVHLPGYSIQWKSKHSLSSNDKTASVSTTIIEDTLLRIVSPTKETLTSTTETSLNEASSAQKEESIPMIAYVEPQQSSMHDNIETIDVQIAEPIPIEQSQENSTTTSRKIEIYTILGYGFLALALVLAVFVTVLFQVSTFIELGILTAILFIPSFILTIGSLGRIRQDK